MSEALTPEQHEELVCATTAVTEIRNALLAEGLNPGLIDTALLLVAGHSVARSCPVEARNDVVTKLTGIFTRMAHGAVHDSPVQ